MLNNNKPFFTVEDAIQIALELYGLRVEARALPGERDCNFHLKTEVRQDHRNAYKPRWHYAFREDTHVHSR